MHDYVWIDKIIYASTYTYLLKEKKKTKTSNTWELISTVFLFHSSQVTGVRLFQRLAKIAKLVLVLPHSNADAERVFSMVGLNKTKTRNSLAMDGTLSSIMAIKMAGLKPCFKWEPSVAIIKASKKPTSQYNQAHKS